MEDNLYNAGSVLLFTAAYAANSVVRKPPPTAIPCSTMSVVVVIISRRQLSSPPQRLSMSFLGFSAQGLQSMCWHMAWTCRCVLTH